MDDEYRLVQSIEPGYKINIPPDLTCKQGDWIAAHENGKFKVANKGDWVFGQIKGNFIVIVYAFRL